jgi:hypothetical protein
MEFPIGCLNYSEWLRYNGATTGDVQDLPDDTERKGGVVPAIPPIMTEERLDIRPYIPYPGDRCGRCVSDIDLVVAKRYYTSGWIINLCDRCLKPEERAALIKE